MREMSLVPARGVRYQQSSSGFCQIFLVLIYIVQEQNSANVIHIFSWICRCHAQH